MCLRTAARCRLGEWAGSAPRSARVASFTVFAVSWCRSCRTARSLRCRVWLLGGCGFRRRAGRWLVISPFRGPEDPHEDSERHERDECERGVQRTDQIACYPPIDQAILQEHPYPAPPIPVVQPGLPGLLQPVEPGCVGRGGVTTGAWLARP